VRALRDEIHTRIAAFIADLDDGERPAIAVGGD
jgi:hypothetical protein